MLTPNIILITIDCLRSDHLGCYGYSRNTSPNIDRLASQGVLFLEAISNGGRTPDSFPSILASQLPPIDNSEYEQIMERNITLAELLREVGYQTFAFHCNPFLSRFYHYDRGFDIFEDNMGGANDQHGVSKLLGGNVDILMKMKIRLSGIIDFILYLMGGEYDVSAGNLTNQAVQHIDHDANKFFMWIHYMDTHYPCLPPLEYVYKTCGRHISRFQLARLYSKQLKSIRDTYSREAKWFSPSELETLIDLYDANIRYVDDSIGELLEKLDLGDTVVIITADHGDAFGEHGVLGHATTIYDELLHVPLVIAGGGIETGATVKELVELVDLPPTIANLVGVGDVKGYNGKDLLLDRNQSATKGAISVRLMPENKQRLISYRTVKLKYIITESMDNDILSEEIYNLEEDACEKHNLCSSHDNGVAVFKDEALGKIKEFKLRKEKDRIRASVRGVLR